MDWSMFPPECKPFTLMSQGIGRQYMSQSVRQYHELSGNNFYSSDSGAIQRLPRYYMDRIFDPEVREEIQARSKAMIDRRDDAQLRRQGFKKIAKRSVYHGEEVVYTQIVPINKQRSEDQYLKKTLSLYYHLCQKWHENDLL